jgi:ubiquinol-cytochrome c reductase cytochrome c subunit
VRPIAQIWRRRSARTPGWLRLALASACAAAGLIGLAGPQAQGTAVSQGFSAAGASTPAKGGALGKGATAPSKEPIAPAPGEDIAPTPSSPALIAQGRTLYAEGCSSCHAMSLRGRANVAPALIGVGAGPTDFYLSTGRMPLESPRVEPLRAPPHYSRRQIDALVAFVASFGGPPAPDAIPARGDLALGLHDFTLDCAGCHQIVGRGGLTIGAPVPDLQSATARQVAEAVRMGPYLMPHFDSAQLDQHALDSVARYVLWTRAPSNKGGWGIYNLGPIPEGMVAWFLLLLSLVLFARLIGERTA